MAWVSPKVYAILSSSEEGKDIIERLGDMTPEECEKELDAFFGAGGKGEKSGNDYSKAREDDEAEERAYREQGDAEVSDEDLEDEEEISDEEISVALDDNSWSITDNDTVDSYSKFIADKVGCSQEQVLSVMSQEAGRELGKDEQMAKVLNFDGEEEEPKAEPEEMTSEEVEEALKDFSAREQLNGRFDFDDFSKKKVEDLTDAQKMRILSTYSPNLELEDIAQAIENKWDLPKKEALKLLNENIDELKKTNGEIDKEKYAKAKRVHDAAFVKWMLERKNSL